MKEKGELPVSCACPEGRWAARPRSCQYRPDDSLPTPHGPGPRRFWLPTAEKWVQLHPYIISETFFWGVGDLSTASANVLPLCCWISIWNLWIYLSESRGGSQRWSERGLEHFSCEEAESWDCPVWKREGFGESLEQLMAPNGELQEIWRGTFYTGI